MENLKGSLTITAKDIQTIEGKSMQSARKELKIMKDILQKDKISIKEYCDYWKFDIEEIVIHLNKYR